MQNYLSPSTLAFYSFDTFTTTYVENSWTSRIMLQIRRVCRVTDSWIYKKEEENKHVHLQPRPSTLSLALPTDWQKSGSWLRILRAQNNPHSAKVTGFFFARVSQSNLRRTAYTYVRTVVSTSLRLCDTTSRSYDSFHGKYDGPIPTAHLQRYLPQQSMPPCFRRWTVWKDSKSECPSREDTRLSNREECRNNQPAERLTAYFAETVGNLMI